MAKDTEKLIRQLSLISYLMAERRPVTASEIRRDVEGYSGMNEDAFARRFYADRSELDSLGIHLTVDKPSEAGADQESYSLRSENFHLDSIEFTDKELAALRTALQLLDGEFAYAEPLRLALQQITWGRPSPLRSPEQQRSVALAVTASAGGHELSQRLAKIETAIFRNKTVAFDYYTMERDELGSRKVDPYHLLYQGGEFYLLGRSHERDAIRVFRLSRIQGKVAYATKAEHDFKRPSNFDPREYASRAEWQLGEQQGEAEILLSQEIAWQIERHFGRYGHVSENDHGDKLFLTPYASSRMVISFVLGLGKHARLLGPTNLLAELHQRLERVAQLHRQSPSLAPKAKQRSERRDRSGGEGGSSKADAVIRPERFARLVTLAGILIDAGRAGKKLQIAEVQDSLKLTSEELHEDIAVLNVVNFGGGSYVLYAEIDEQAGEIEVDPEPYSDNFDRPARLLPVEAKALIAAIDLIGEHIPEGSLSSARAKIVGALGEDPMDQGLQVASAKGDDRQAAKAISEAIQRHKIIEIEYYKQAEEKLSARKAEPYALVNGREGWYVACFDLRRSALRHFRLDRIKMVKVTDKSFRPRADLQPAAEIDGWMRTGVLPKSQIARVLISPERARWARESHAIAEELKDGSVIFELSFAGIDWLVREILKEAGDAVVLEPADAREAVAAAASELLQRAHLAVH